LVINAYFANIGGDFNGPRLEDLMADLKINYQSLRSEKARISARFNDIWSGILIAFAILFVLSGVGLIFIKMPIGWFLLGLVAWPIMMINWYDGDLKHLAISNNFKNMDDIISAEVLGRLSSNLTPKILAGILSDLPGGHFFAVRFGIGSSFLQDLSSDNVSDISAIWQEAINLQEATGSKNISAVVLIVALINCNPSSQNLISRLQLSLEDLVDGIKWFNHLRAIVEETRKPKLTGGIARDWSFGWTPLLNRFGQNASQKIDSVSLLTLPSHDQAIDKIMNIFDKNGRQNVVLVGPSGVGKTRIVHSFASKLVDGKSNVPRSLKYNQVFILDASSLIAAAPERGGLEKLIPQLINEALKAKNMIICLDNAHLFFEEGIGSVDISNVILPIIESSRLRIILAVDEQRFLQISMRHPEVANALNQIVIEPSSRDETIAIMQDRSVLIEYQNNAIYMYQALIEAYRLGDRYVFDLSMPGKALKLMEAAANYNNDGVVSAESVRQSIQKTLGIKISVASEENDRKKLLNLEDLIHRRMINQTRAVGVVSDALRRARAGVRNQDRPIGTFLFLGPTGVGKTELAKSLAEVYFGGEGRMIRLDMNEYVEAGDVARLVADGADNPNSLTTQVMKQPFSVVLLDEIEKAHPNVLSALLQLLDEGVLRDIKNREVSFRDAILIATSNAGADKIREHIERGIDIIQYEPQFIDELISSNQFRPEFLNRFDEIVIFRPLNKPELLQVVDLMIKSVNKTLALQKVSVNVAPDAKGYLVEHGYDPRLGARPMRRVVQKAVENTVAKQMLSGNVEPGSMIEISLEQVQQILGSVSKSILEPGATIDQSADNN
jgi:ATP-dependent Clp protease ATP-binding subunit ClpC